MRLVVDVEELVGAWRITVDAGDPHGKTVIDCPDLRQASALAGEVVFIVCDPLQRLFRAPAGQGGMADGLADAS